MSEGLKYYTERRAEIDDEAERRVDMLAAQNARQHHAIAQTVEGMRRMINSLLIDHYTAERLHGFINLLARANERREGDGIPLEPSLSKTVIAELAPAISFELVEDEHEISKDCNISTGLPVEQGTGSIVGEPGRKRVQTAATSSAAPAA